MTQSWYCYCNTQGCEYTEEVYYTAALELLNTPDDVSYDYDGTPYTTPGNISGNSYWPSEVAGAVAGAVTNAAKRTLFVAHQDHWQDSVQVGKYTKLTCSASRDIPRKKDGGYDWTYPDLGVYLSSGWFNVTSWMWTNTPKIKLPKFNICFPILFVDWPDFGIIPDNALVWLVDEVIRHLEAGEWVDIGCMGSHGRTGTLLTCIIAKLEGLDAETATKATRKRHCKDAVEGTKQHNAIRRYLGEPEEEYAFYVAKDLVHKDRGGKNNATTAATACYGSIPQNSVPPGP